MAAIIEIDNNIIKDTIRKIKYLRFMNIFIRKDFKFTNEKVFKFGKLSFGENDEEDYINIYDLEFGNRMEPIIELLFSDNVDDVSIDYAFQPSFSLESLEEDEKEEIIKNNTEIEKYIKEDFKIDDNDISLIYMNTEEVGDILVFSFYNENISKAISLIANNKDKFEELESDLNNIVIDNIHHDRGILTAITQRGENEYHLSFISCYYELEQLYYCSYDLYKFYNKCLDILKENNIKVGN